MQIESLVYAFADFVNDIGVRKNIFDQCLIPFFPLLTFHEIKILLIGRVVFMVLLVSTKPTSFMI